MTPPKEKAIELLDKFRNHAKYWDCYNDEPLEENHSKLCALIAVDEIIDIVKTTCDYSINVLLPYWQEVKQEIENL